MADVYSSVGSVHTSIANVGDIAKNETHGECNHSTSIFIVLFALRVGTSMCDASKKSLIWLRIRNGDRWIGKCLRRVRHQTGSAGRPPFGLAAVVRKLSHMMGLAGR